jgi:hypothetical protein
MTRHPARWRRLATGLCAVLAVGVAAGCASRHEGTPTFIPTLTELPAGQAVFQLYASGGGFEPLGATIARRPSLTIYGDGTAYVMADLSQSQIGGAPWVLRKGRVPTPTLTRLAEDAAGSELFAGADFGTPQITDLGDTTLGFHPDRTPERMASAYALQVTDADEHLTGTQATNRRALRTFIDRLQDAVALPDSPDRGRWTPDRVDVIERTGTSSGGAEPIPWPGPALPGLLTARSRFGGCGILSGPAAAKLYAAARAHDSTRWTVGGVEKAIIVRALLPGEKGCPS